MNKRKIVLLASVLMMVAILAVSGTLAYFTDADEAINTFTVGNVDIELEEENWEETGKEEAKDVYPGEAIAKDPTITNIGANPCFVRLEVTGWDCLKDAGLAESDIIYRTDYVDGKLGDKWVLHTDGYFYYDGVLAVGEKTDALFDQIVIPFDLTNDLSADTEYDIVVKAYAIQAQGARPSFAAVEKMTVAEIAEWFGNYSEDLAE